MRAAAEYGHVGVFCGGASPERDISLQSGRAVYEALKAGGLEASLVDTARGRIRFADYDRAFILLHGRDGEDGKFQAVLEYAGVPYTGSAVAAASLSMHKAHTKAVWGQAGVPSPPCRVARAGEPIELGGLSLPVYVKPMNEGSSIGISRVTERAALAAAVAAAAVYDRRVLIEQAVAGEEYTYSYVAGLPQLPLIGLQPATEFYDYEAKYLRDDTRYLVDPALAADLRETYLAQARLAFDCLGLSGWGRVDFMVDADGSAWFIEANSVPGMTGHSLVPMAAAAVGVDFATLCFAILESSYGP